MHQLPGHILSLPGHRLLTVKSLYSEEYIFSSLYPCRTHVNIVIFTIDGRRNKEIDTRIGEANAVLREFYRSVATKRELSNLFFGLTFRSFVS